MPFTFLDLQNELNPILWPEGQQENLVGAHRAMMVEALVDLQKWDECLQVNNTQVIPQCDTLFKCGYTVFDAPKGAIKRIYTIDRINQETGREDPSVPIDWCSVVNYRQQEFAELDRYVSETLAGTLNAGFWAWCGFSFSMLAGIFAFPTCWATKYKTFVPPTDAGLDKAPPLPLGFHYAQTSTDEPDGADTQTNLTGIRAQWGMWAIQGGQIMLAPWIQSTETVVVEWDGVKRTWNDFDIVDDDPDLKLAVEYYVRWQHAQKYDRDYDAALAAQSEYNRMVAVLMQQCRRQTEVRDVADAMNSPARGSSLVVPTFVNEPQTATARCPQNTTGNPVTVTIPAGTVISPVSQADANARARSLALQQAALQLDCTAIPVTYFNTPQTYTAQCQGGVGNPVSITIAAGQFTSTVSQAAADAAALAEATSQAISALSCTFVNTAQSYTAQCPAGHAGSDVTRTTPAGTYSSAVSQADANAQALAAATTAALAALSCAGSPVVYTNTAQSVVVRYGCLHGNFNTVLTTTVPVPAGLFSSQISQADANQQAIIFGNQRGLAFLVAQCSRQPNPAP